MREEILDYLNRKKEEDKDFPYKEIHYFDCLDSTNEEAKRAFRGGASEFSLFIADRQTAGKGRRGRSWSSPGGRDLFFSILLKPAIPISSVSALTLLAALAAAGVCRKYSCRDCLIKWPNDIVLHGRKICGILTEMAAGTDEIDYVIVGVGFNLNRMEFPEDLEDIATSIRKETGKEINRPAFLADFLTDFHQSYLRFIKEQSFASFVTEYNAWLVNRGRQVRFLRRGQETIRTALGIDENGELVVEDEEGRRETVLSGEVSVRGLYGYA